MKHTLTRIMSTGIALAVLGISTFGAGPAAAAERVRLNYRGFSRTVPVGLLVLLAETGESGGVLGGLLNQAGQNPRDLRTMLTRPLPANVVVLDRALNSPPGDWTLDYLGESIHTGTGEADRQALRSALVLSAADDNQITLLEVLQNYPTEEVVLEGDRIEATVTRLADFLRPLSIFL